ncbi:hypothetical protein ZOSMA_100G00260 [Zostera marina]|uniref:Uncharacterized protein n=1 Tax=Zostera marina TaxID=29655 RepID=A0A0K9Q5I8_ZOSMR|nr:hypothetical protein ZOSMA_100G00260 [Zostera marina]
MGKNGNASVVLRKVYGERVRTIEEAMLFLLPTPLPAPRECACEGRVCFGCAGRSFLIRPDDGIEYRKLLKRGFCAIDPNATLPVGIRFHDQISFASESYFSYVSQFLSISTLRLLLSRGRKMHIQELLQNDLINDEKQSFQMPNSAYDKAPKA